MRISDLSSDVCSSDLAIRRLPQGSGIIFRHYTLPTNERRPLFARARAIAQRRRLILLLAGPAEIALAWKADGFHGRFSRKRRHARLIHTARSEEHTSELQSLMRISYAVFCLKKKKRITETYK